MGFPEEGTGNSDDLQHQTDVDFHHSQPTPGNPVCTSWALPSEQNRPAEKRRGTCSALYWLLQKKIERWLGSLCLESERYPSFDEPHGGETYLAEISQSAFFHGEILLETSWSVDPPASMSLYSTSSFFIRLLSTADYSKLRETAHNLDGYKLRVSTTCSGSDVGIIAIKSVLRAMNKEFGATGCLYTYSNRFHSYHYKICSKYRNHHLIWSLRTL